MTYYDKQLQQIGAIVLEEAQDIFTIAKVGSDFCIQYIGSDCVVFGGTNRLIWRPVKGFTIDPSYCSETFIKAFETFQKDRLSNRQPKECRIDEILEHLYNLKLITASEGAALVAALEVTAQHPAQIEKQYGTGCVAGIVDLLKPETKDSVIQIGLITADYDKFIHGTPQALWNPLKEKQDETS